ncbi:Methylmalonyl-CoA carboxyltransferase 12S subunit [archaeon HR06]|nr:Methylmalonyl-CoA carboxyltransferase 12S subunit [archaeon HR06]
MGSKFSRADLNLAWPTAEIAVMGAEAAINVIFRKDIEKANDREALIKKLIEDYRDKFANPYVAAERGIIDMVIDPADTRLHLIKGLEILKDKSEIRPYKKHGNIQL